MVLLVLAENGWVFDSAKVNEINWHSTSDEINFARAAFEKTKFQVSQCDIYCCGFENRSDTQKNASLRNEENVAINHYTLFIQFKNVAWSSSLYFQCQQTSSADVCNIELHTPL